jgi:DNA polymerase III epsilon subunit-like protein
MSISWPVHPTVAIDLETTGLNTERDRIIMYGIFGTGHDSAEISVAAVVDAEVSVGRDVRNIPGITPDDVRAAVPLRDGHLDALFRYLHDAVVIMHNAAHDWAIVRSEFRRHGRAPPRPRMRICTLLLCKHRLRLPSTDSACATSHTLQNVARYLRVPLTTAHNALHDARATFWVFIVCANRFWWRYGQVHWSGIMAGRSLHFPLPAMLCRFRRETPLCEWTDDADTAPACGDLRQQFARGVPAKVCGKLLGIHT